MQTEIYKSTSSFSSKVNQALALDNIIEPIENQLISTREAEFGIARIKDPLWRRVCVDLLKILGPAAFKDLWKIKLIQVSSEGRKACLTCPTESLAETIEKYHFVIIDVLKKYYPFLFSIETETCLIENCQVHRC
ncbi:MAG: hypothetical protein JSR85_02160 [Proteobacteria bacterium]|nr:hypothetical protein [Pseudomonadota bacterium]